MYKITHAACQGSPHWLLRHWRNKIKACVVAEYLSTLPYATPCLEQNWTACSQLGVQLLSVLTLIMIIFFSCAPHSASPVIRGAGLYCCHIHSVSVPGTSCLAELCRLHWVVAQLQPSEQQADISAPSLLASGAVQHCSSAVPAATVAGSQSHPRQGCRVETWRKNSNVGLGPWAGAGKTTSVGSWGCALGSRW